jgi:hypothetical protein
MAQPLSAPSIVLVLRIQSWTFTPTEYRPKLLCYLRFCHDAPASPSAPLIPK